MKIKQQDYDNVTVVELNGEFVEDFITLFNDTVSELIASGRAGIVIDMSNVTFVDSKGLEQLLWLRDYCNDNKSQLKLAGIDENCLKILEITQINSEFDKYVELAEAVKSFT